MSDLIACRSCRRHVRVSDDRCPFCASTRRGALALIELGLAATASVSLAACYGAPPRAGNIHDRDNAHHAFRVSAEPGARARATANARAQGCDVDSGSVLKTQCGKIRLDITESDAGLDVRCDGAIESECRALVNKLIEAPPPGQ